MLVGSADKNIQVLGDPQIFHEFLKGAILGQFGQSSLSFVDAVVGEAQVDLHFGEVLCFPGDFSQGTPNVFPQK